MARTFAWVSKLGDLTEVTFLGRAANVELREDGGAELREDGGYELRE